MLTLSVRILVLSRAGKQNVGRPTTEISEDIFKLEIDVLSKGLNRFGYVHCITKQILQT